MKRKLFPAGVFVILVLSLGFFLYSQNIHSVVRIEDSSISKTDHDVFLKAINTLYISENIPKEHKIVISNIDLEGDWAIAEGQINFIDNQGRKEPTMIILHKESNGWVAAFPSSSIFSEWVDQIPPSLLPEEIKDILR